jgi:high-affinity nickel-transport protein
MYPQSHFLDWDDTASEVGLLAMTAGAAAGNLPISAVLSLPILFAAGMTLMDTTDGVLMSKAYDWAFLNPIRKVFYNVTTTGLSVGVALVIGSIELLQVFVSALGLRGGFCDAIARLDLGSLGYIIVGLFLRLGFLGRAWNFSALRALWSRPDTLFARWGVEHSHEHWALTRAAAIFYQSLRAGLTEVAAA